MVLLSILVTSFLEKALRVGQNSKSIEQSTQAYYYATSQIEKQLVNNTNLKKKPWEIQPITVGDESTHSGVTLSVHTGSSTIPQAGKGNSPFNPDYNLISLDKPVQLVISDDVSNWSNVDFDFRIPAYSGSSGSQTGALRSGIMTDSGALFWSIGDYETVLHASGSESAGLFPLAEINNTNGKKISHKKGYSYKSGVLESKDFSNFYNNYLKAHNKCQDYACTFRLGMLRAIPAAVQ